EIQAPMVQGATIINALETLDQAGLYLKVTRLAYHQEVGKDRIISQSPAPGEPIKVGRELKVVISKGPKSQAMPNLTGVTRRGLEKLLAQEELRLTRTIKAHLDGTEMGVILAQSPPPQSTIRRGSEVTTLESLGPTPKYVMAPDLSDKSLEWGMRTLGELDLKVGEVAYRNDGRKARGTVLYQEPSFGRRVEKGSSVALIVSEGLEDGIAAAPSYTILFYTIPDGPEPVKISIIQSNQGGEKEVYNRVHMPGDTVSLLVEVRGKTSARIFLNNKLSDVKRF
ncbi:MAG: PASTA domain-containing protein, partial [Nitrospinota bacterium]|nr:PASTA domain-containing protein [Nitrospinota bacterium]